MKKTFKKIAASVMAVATLAVGVASMSVSAVGSLGTITHSKGFIEVKCSPSRLAIASVTVYRDGTGAYVTTSSGSNKGGDGTTATASVSLTEYPPSLYNFKMYAAIYNSTVEASGVAESWQCYAD